jgi:hypothetical protein
VKRVFCAFVFDHLLSMSATELAGDSGHVAHGGDIGAGRAGGARWRQRAIDAIAEKSVSFW